MKAFYSDTFELPLPESHRFPMAKYRLLRERIEASPCPGLQLLIPDAATDEQLMRVHDRGWLERLVSGDLSPLEIRRIGFPWSPAMVQRSRRSVGASIAAARSALTDGVAINLAGGTHHAFPDAGQGYCVFNDVAVAARDLQASGATGNVLFVDLDVHQGNGTAAIARDDPTLFAFSMHCNRNFPFRKTPGDLDVSLPPETGDRTFLEELDRALHQIVHATGFQPDLVFYLAGADPWRGDRLGHLALSKQGLKQRDQQVFRFCEKISAPCVVVMSGGYAPNVNDIVDIHFQTVRSALEYWRTGTCTGTLPAPG